jgi:hypothetical protein
VQALATRRFAVVDDERDSDDRESRRRAMLWRIGYWLEGVSEGRGVAGALAGLVLLGGGLYVLWTFGYPIMWMLVVGIGFAVICAGLIGRG